MNSFKSCIYFGYVFHERKIPILHRLKYYIFQMLFDIDELPIISKQLKAFSHNRFNWISFNDSDHGDGRCGNLRSYVDRLAVEAGLNLVGGKIFLFCMPRILGYVFNPISIYYCYNKIGLLVMIIYEVNNTFGENHTYVIPVSDIDGLMIKQTCEKKFYVSPFMDMNLIYNFALTRPSLTLEATIRARTIDGEPMISASFRGRRVELSDRMLVAALVRYPLLTLGVVAAIHWEALRLCAKGLRLRRRPSAPSRQITIVGVDAPAPASA